MARDTEEKVNLSRRRTLQQMLSLGAGLAVSADIPAHPETTAPQAQTAEPASGPPYRRILIARDCHPAVSSAAKILAGKLGIPESNIKSVSLAALPQKEEVALIASPGAAEQRQWLGAEAKEVRFDGYLIGFKNGAAMIWGNRPRSLLYAAGDCLLWRDTRAGVFRREPSFELRVSHGSRGRTIAEAVAAVGANLMQGDPAVATLQNSFPNVFNLLSRDDQERLERSQSRMAERSRAVLQECHNADVPVYTSIYGNNFERWSPALYKAVLQAYPSTQGKPEPHSWEKAPLCPSDPMTWKIIGAYLRELMERSGADGFIATFWDQYGMYCQNERCVRDGLNKFPNEVYLNVQHLYDTVVRAMGKGLIVRTWSSGCPHWLGDQYVHAPGYGGFGGSGEELWGRVIRELPAEIMLQTKVYNCDVEPDPPFSPLIGAVKPHTQIAEYQIIGQTTGRYYFPASSVNTTAWTMKKAHGLIGPTGGVALGYGATMQPEFSLLDDIVNGINLYAARELSWNVNASLDEIWKNWATPIYGPKAAPHIIKALQLSEDAVNLTFSVLGLGSSTNSNFVSSIGRKETLLRYTNRYFLPEYAKYLEPTQENIARVIAEKETCMDRISQMFQELELAKPHLTAAQSEELETRFNWLKEFAICRKYHDISLWRYRYLRYLATQLTTEPEQMKYLAEAYDQVSAHRKLLFQYDPKLKFSCYDSTLGELPRKPGLGDPMPVMRQLYDESRKLAEQSVGPDYLPAEWMRD
jgi:hypothetical protein